MENDKIGYASSALQLVFAGLTPDTLYKTIMFALSILTALVTLAFNIWKWVKEAKKDGKITIDELKEGAEIVKDSAEEIAEIIKNNKEEESKNDDSTRNQE